MAPFDASDPQDGAHAGVQADSWPDLFNMAAYAALHPPGLCVERAGLGVFRATRTRSAVFRSPGRAPYGGFDVSPTCDDQDYDAFVGMCETALRGVGATGVEVGLPPLCYSDVLARRLVVLSRRGYRVIRQELNQAIALHTADWSIARGARRSLEKAVRAGVSVRELSPAEVGLACDVLLENRASKGRSLSMSPDDIARMIRVFPERLYLFGAFQDGIMLAAAVTVAVNDRVLYVYAWGDRQDAKAFSPVTSLAQHIVQFATLQGFQVLDLGTSSVDGVVDAGLVAFKRSLGCKPGLKLWVGKAFI